MSTLPTGSGQGRGGGGGRGRGSRGRADRGHVVGFANPTIGASVGAGTLAPGPGVSAAGHGVLSVVAGGGRGRGRVSGGEKVIQKPGRAKIVIKPIVKDHQRQTTYTKRTKGIRKKVEELAILCDLEICLICYGANTGTGTDKQKNNENNNLFWGKPSVDQVLKRYKGIAREEQDKKKTDNTSLLEFNIKKQERDLKHIQDRNAMAEVTNGFYRQGYQVLNECTNEVLSQCTLPQLLNFSQQLEEKRYTVYAKLQQIRSALDDSSFGQWDPRMRQYFTCGGGGGDGAVLAVQPTGANYAYTVTMPQNYPSMQQGLAFNKPRQIQQQQSYQGGNQASPPRDLMLQYVYQAVPENIQNRNGLEQQNGQVRVNRHQQQQGQGNQGKNLLNAQYQQPQQFHPNQHAQQNQLQFNQQQQQQQQLHANLQGQQKMLRMNHHQQQQQQLHAHQQEQLQYPPSGSQEELQFQNQQQQQHEANQQEQLQYQQFQNQQQQHEANQHEQLQYQPSMERLQSLQSRKRGSQADLQSQPSMKRRPEQLQYLDETDF